MFQTAHLHAGALYMTQTKQGRSEERRAGGERRRGGGEGGHQQRRQGQQQAKEGRSTCGGTRRSSSAPQREPAQRGQRLDCLGKTRPVQSTRLTQKKGSKRAGKSSKQKTHTHTQRRGSERREREGERRMGDTQGMNLKNPVHTA